MGRCSVGDGPAAKKKGWTPSRTTAGWKVNNSADSGFPPSPTATALSLLPFPVQWDPDASFTSCEGGKRDKMPMQSCLDLVKRVRDYEYIKP